MTTHFLQGIDTIIIRVSSIQAASVWYTTNLGFKILFEDPIHKLTILDTASAVSITLWETPEPIIVNPKTTPYPIFRTPNASEARQQLIQRGVKVGEIITDHAVTYFTFNDPDSNILEVCQVHT